MSSPSPFPPIELCDHEADERAAQAYVQLLRETICRSLEALGHTPKTPASSEDALVFTDPTLGCLVAVQLHPQGDANYVRLLLPQFWSLEDASEDLRARLAMATVAGRCKLAHLFIGGSEAHPSVCAEVELLMPMVRREDRIDWAATADQLALQCAPPLLRRYLGALHHAAQRFAHEMALSQPH